MNISRAAPTTAHAAFPNRSVLVLGGSTSRDLAGEFMRVVLPPSTTHAVQRSWTSSRVESWELFPAIGKTAFNFTEQYTESVMRPLREAGWQFTQVDPRAAWAGCASCVSAYRNIDYVAELNSDRGPVRYEFSWKPELFTDADEQAFENRYCSRHYDLVFIGKGLHDAAFHAAHASSERFVETQLSRLAEQLRCLPTSALVFLRTPYVSAVPREQSILVKMAGIMVTMVANGAFRPLNTFVVDGQQLTSMPGHPRLTGRPGEVHHYREPLQRTIWAHVAAVAAQQWQ